MSCAACRSDEPSLQRWAAVCHFKALHTPADQDIHRWGLLQSQAVAAGLEPEQRMPAVCVVTGAQQMPLYCLQSGSWCP